MSAEYRLIGYENRALREEDFDNDAVDAGDIGAGHQVTALYEIVPAGQPRLAARAALSTANRRAAARRRGNGELAFLRLRYKLPGEDQSRLIEQPVARRPDRAARARRRGDTAFAAAVAAYGQLLRGDTNLGGFSFADARRAGRRAAPAAITGGASSSGLTELAERHRFASGDGGNRLSARAGRRPVGAAPRPPWPPRSSPS